MLLKQKKFITTSLLITTVLGVIFSQSGQNSNTQIFANTSSNSIVTTLNRALSASTTLDVFNLTTSVNGVSNSSVYSSVTITNVTSNNGNTGLELNGNNNNTARILVNFNNQLVKYNAFEIAISRETGNSANTITISLTHFSQDPNILTTTSQTYTSSTGALITPRLTVNGTIKSATITTDITAQNRWLVDEIRSGFTFDFSQSASLATFSDTLSTLTGDGCTPQSNETVASTQQVDELIALYNSMTTDQKTTFKTNYPNAWGRLQLLAKKANKTVS